MHLLGHHLPDHKPARIALTAFYGISYKISERLLARLQINREALVSSLTEAQITSLSAYLSSPSTSVAPLPQPLASTSAATAASSEGSKPKSVVRMEEDPLNSLKIETDLRRNLQSDIGHHRVVGTYRGRRHAYGLPVRGQNTRSNAQTAKKLNRVDRRRFSSIPMIQNFSTPTIPQPPSWLARIPRSFPSLP